MPKSLRRLQPWGRPMRKRGPIFNWGFWKPRPAASEETRMIVARRKVFAMIHDLEREGEQLGERGRMLRHSAGQTTGFSRAVLLWRAHRVEEASRFALRKVVEIRKSSRRAGLDAPGHRMARRDAFRNASGGED